jgi:hypothetical protein
MEMLPELNSYLSEALVVAVVVTMELLSRDLEEMEHSPEAEVAEGQEICQQMLLELEEMVQMVKLLL